MAGLKSFLYGIAPILGVTGAILYERQRALVSLGVLKSAQGHGPGSGVPLTADNAAAVIISLLAAGSLSEVDGRVVALCNALPDDADATERRLWEKRGAAPTFQSEVARIISGQHTQFRPHSHRHHYRGIRVSRCWRGQIMRGIGTPRPIDFFVDERDRHISSGRISITAEIEEQMLAGLVAYSEGVLSRTTELEEEDKQ